MHLNLVDLIDWRNLQERVELLGGISNTKVCEVLNRGHIFLNTSLSEAFCIANLEAAFAGLLVVTTNVGGIPEVLPNNHNVLKPMVLLADPTVESVI